MLSRRSALLSGVSTFAASTIGATFPVIGQSVRIRRDINSLDVDDPIVENYRLAVRQLHERDSSLEHSWIGQARIHFEHCHGIGDSFLAWHRAYIHAFEDIVREASGDDSWALPYWDWTENRQMPVHFFGSGNELDTQTWNDPDPTGQSSVRRLGPNDTLSLNAVDISRIMNQRNFAVFENRLDRGPHGAVHVAIGGHMRAFYSPLDPIFWLHHCNVDRLWEKWLESQGHENPSTAAWLDREFRDTFADPQGQLIGSVRTGDVLDTIGLGYIYDDSTIEKTAAFFGGGVSAEELFSGSMLTAENAIPSTLNIPVEFSLAASEATTIPKGIVDKELVWQGRVPRQVIARLSEISIPADAENYTIRVFLNCPYLDPSVPPEDPHYVAEINLFGLTEMKGMTRGEVEMNRDILVDLTETLVALNARRTPVEDKLSVQTIAVATGGGDPKGVDFKIGRIDVTTAEA